MWEIYWPYGYTPINSVLERARFEKRKAVKEFLDTTKVSLICLQETKMDVIDNFVVMQCLGPSFDGFV